MKNGFVLGIVLLLAALPLASAGVPVEAPEAPSLSERYIIGFYEPPAYEVGDTYQGERIVAVDHDLRYIVVATLSVDLLEARVQLDDSVRYLEWDNPAYATLNFVPNDALYGHAAHWGSKRIGAEAAWDRTLGTTAVKVAMLDSGLNRNHEEFAGQSRVLAGYDFINGDGTPEDSSSCNYHGTHTTGTAGSTINNGKGTAGMSQHTILPVKIFAGGFFGCSSSTTAIVNGLKYAADQGAHLSSNSWGGGASSTSINDAIRYAHDRGVIHVAAAGNSGPCTNCVGQPWYDNPSISIVVTSLSDGDVFSDFSSEGPQVDIIAPGDYIAAPTSGTSDYHAMSGTSMATPHVTGALALYLAQNPGAGFSTVESALKTTAENLGFTAARQGAGLVRADALTSGGGTPTYACSDGVDNDGDGLADLSDPGCASSTDNDETDPASGGITLSATGSKVKGSKTADLAWSGASSASVDVYRNGAFITTTANDGAHTDSIGGKGGGSYTYQVCEAGTSTCSNTATVTF